MIKFKNRSFSRATKNSYQTCKIEKKKKFQWNCCLIQVDCDGIDLKALRRIHNLNYIQCRILSIFMSYEKFML